MINVPASVLVGGVALVIAAAICVEGLVWVRAQRRHLDAGAENLRALLAEIDDGADGA